MFHASRRTPRPGLPSVAPSLSLALGLALCFPGAAPLAAATLTVRPDGTGDYTSIQAAGCERRAARA